jgi:hypothetical protein
MNEPATAMIVVVLGRQPRLAQSDDPSAALRFGSRPRSCLAWPKQDHTPGLRRFSSPHAALLPRLCSRGARPRSRFFQQTYRRYLTRRSNLPARRLSLHTVFGSTALPLLESSPGQLGRGGSRQCWPLGYALPGREGSGRNAMIIDDGHRWPADEWMQNTVHPHHR